MLARQEVQTLGLLSHSLIHSKYILSAGYVQGNELGPELPLWSSDSNGGNKTLNYGKSNNVSMLGTVALKEKGRVPGKHDTVGLGWDLWP